MRSIVGLSTVVYLFVCFSFSTRASSILLPMDAAQKNHLKAYGLAYWTLNKSVEVSWLLNYRGGSFMTDYRKEIETECIVRGISYEVISEAEAAGILEEIARPDINMDAVKLEVPPKIAVYSPKSKMPWDDAVTMVLTYAEIPYTVIYDDEILYGDLPKYDWLHLHHEDFTGQYGKFYASYYNMPWYKAQVSEYEATAARHGFSKVSQLKLAVAKKIKDYVIGGGFLFAMCSATDSYDIALAADGVDICESMYDGDPADRAMQSKLDFKKTFAFHQFSLVTNPYEYEYSNIDNDPRSRPVTENDDFFTVFQFSAKWDPIPTMLTQNHETLIKNFLGQTTCYKKQLVKPEVLVMGQQKMLQEAKYIHGTQGKGTWTFYGGHDPEDYQHIVGEDPTDLNLHPNSPGYRLILNNILFPAAKKKKQKT